MSDAILGQVALGYSPFIDRNRSLSATRLTVFPLTRDAPLDAAELLAAVAGVWPAEGTCVSLNVASETLLQDDLVRSIEGESLYDFREAADTLLLGVGEINRAELRALTSAAQLE